MLFRLYSLLVWVVAGDVWFWLKKFGDNGRQVNARIWGWPIISAAIDVNHEVRDTIDFKMRKMARTGKSGSRQRVSLHYITACTAIGYRSLSCEREGGA